MHVKAIVVMVVAIVRFIVVVGVLLINLILVLAMVGIIAWQVSGLWLARRRHVAGAQPKLDRVANRQRQFRHCDSVAANVDYTHAIFLVMVHNLAYQE